MLFSICIPVRNDLSNLKRCLAGFSNQLLSDSEILICDDGSTRPITVQDFDGIQVACTLVRQAWQGPAAARNRLAGIARGSYLFFVDADTVAHVDMLEQARRIITEHPQVDAFYGSYDDEPADQSLVSTYRNLLHHYTHHQAATAERITTFWCGCGVIRRELYLECGGLWEFFDKPSIEDIELGYRLNARGVAIRVFPQCQVKHLKRWTFMNMLYTDLFRRGIPWVRLMRARGEWASQLNFSWSQRIANVSAAAFLLFGLLAFVRVGFAGVAVLALAIFVITNLSFFRLVRKKRGMAAFIMAIPLHITYALVCVVSVAAAFVYPRLKLPPQPTLDV